LTKVVYSPDGAYLAVVSLGGAVIVFKVEELMKGVK